MSRSTPPASGADTDKVITINWRLLGRRLWLRSSQLFTSARHRAAHTEYIPPSWMGRLRLTWFRIGLIGLAIFVFSQKQIDVTVSMGAEGVGVSTAGMTAPRDADPASQTTTLSMLPGSSTASAPAAPTWTVRRYEEQAVRRYVERFTRVARTEEEKYAIPAAAKMAMALLDSEAGTAAVARQDNNHFRTAAGDQRFDNAWSSWRDHSEYISRRFPELASESVNHQQWIAALGRSGYSRDPQYTQKLLRLIEHFDLDWL
jgi:flagellum-specific peptidoglycan hydrolase FlgJ